MSSSINKMLYTGFMNACMYGPYCTVKDRCSKDHTHENSYRKVLIEKFGENYVSKLSELPLDVWYMPFINKLNKY